MKPKCPPTDAPKPDVIAYTFQDLEARIKTLERQMEVLSKKVNAMDRWDYGPRKIS